VRRPRKNHHFDLTNEDDAHTRSHTHTIYLLHIVVPFERLYFEKAHYKNLFSLKHLISSLLNFQSGQARPLSPHCSHKKVKTWISSINTLRACVCVFVASTASARDLCKNICANL
jgi:hypothetical protein